MEIHSFYASPLWVFLDVNPKEGDATSLHMPACRGFLWVTPSGEEELLMENSVKMWGREVFSDGWSASSRILSGLTWEHWGRRFQPARAFQR